jgi:hypothetical protein
MKKKIIRKERFFPGVNVSERIIVRLIYDDQKE